MPKDINRDNSYSGYMQFQNYSSSTKEGTSTHQPGWFCLASIVWDFFECFGLGMYFGGWARGGQHNTGRSRAKCEQLSLEYLLKFWNV